MNQQNGKPPMARPIGGEALFTVHYKGSTLQMLIHGKPIAAAQALTGEAYEALFDHVKAAILALAKRSGSSGVSATTAGPSTRNLAAIPAPARLRELLRALAVLDMILVPDWESRGYSFDAAWGEHQLASFRDGSGDWFLVWFPGPDSAVIKGFGHESPMTPFKRPNDEPWPGLFDGLPPELAEVRDMKEFPPEEVTYCLWHPEGGRWTMGPVQLPAGEAEPDGSGEHLELLDDKPESYVAMAKDGYEVNPSLAAVRRVYAGEPLSWEIVSRLDAKADLPRVVKDAGEMGYPVAKTLLARAEGGDTKVKGKAKTPDAVKKTKNRKGNP